MNPESLATPSLTVDELADITECFGLTLINAKAHRKVWQLETTTGFKYLKRSRMTPTDLNFIYEALEYLYYQSFKTAPRLAWSKTGRPFVTIENQPYILTDWYFSRELDFNSEADLQQACRLLADFHQKGQGFTPTNEYYQRTCWFNWPNKLGVRLNQLRDFQRLARAGQEISPFNRLYLSHFDSFYRQAAGSFEALQKSSYLTVASLDSQRQSFCHHDYSSRNILCTFDNQLLLVDFDYCIRDLRIHDLINFMVRNLRHRHWEIGVADFMLKEYCRVGKLIPEEIEVMWVLLCWPQDFWQVGLQYYYEKLPWPEERFIRKLQQRIDSRGEREHFLKEFPGRNAIYHWKQNSVAVMNNLVNPINN